MLTKNSVWSRRVNFDCPDILFLKIIGTSISGIPIYVFSYIGEAVRYIGTMAQDLLKLGRTDAVTVADNGYYAVDYSKIDIEFEKLR